MFWKVNLLHSWIPMVLFFFFTPPFSPTVQALWCARDAVSQSCHNHGCCFCLFLDVPHPDFPPPRPRVDSPTIPLFTVFKKKKKIWTFSFTRWRMVLVWEASATFSMIQPWEPRGSASSHPGVSVGSPLKLGTQSSPPWSESLAAATHNPYSKGQLDWVHRAQGEQRDLPPPPTSHFPVTEYLRQLWHVKIETGLNSRHLATAL